MAYRFGLGGMIGWHGFTQPGGMIGWHGFTQPGGMASRGAAAGSHVLQCTASDEYHAYPIRLTPDCESMPPGRSLTVAVRVSFPLPHGRGSVLGRGSGFTSAPLRSRLGLGRGSECEATGGLSSE